MILTHILLSSSYHYYIRVSVHIKEDNHYINISVFWMLWPCDLVIVMRVKVLIDTDRRVTDRFMCIDATAAVSYIALTDSCDVDRYALGRTIDSSV